MRSPEGTNHPAWQTLPFPEALEERGIPKPGKVLARDYKAMGKIPIVDQGQQRIAGWTDDETVAIRDRLPFIVFGDHTRAFKYVDFPFALGADGTQLLKPSNAFNPRFFYYACLHLKLLNRGYNRHFTLLKEQTLPEPPKPEQEKIAAVLWKVQRATEVEEKLITAVQELKQSAMQQLFTRGLRGEQQKETEVGTLPDGWQPLLVRDFGKVITGTTPKTAERRFYEGGVFDFIAPGDLGATTKIRHAAKRITEAGLDVSRVLPKNSVCFVCIGSSIGKVGITTQDRATSNQQINALIVNEEFDPLFVCYLLSYFSDYVSSFSSPSPVPIMSKGTFEQIRLFATRDKAEQQSIARTLSTIDDKIELHERKRELFQEIFRTLLHDFITGRVRVENLDIDTSDVAA